MHDALNRRKAGDQRSVAFGEEGTTQLRSLAIIFAAIVVVAISSIGCGRSESTVRRQFEQNLMSSGSGWRNIGLSQWHGGDEYTAAALLTIGDAEFTFDYSSSSGTTVGSGWVNVNHRGGNFKAYFSYSNWVYERETVEAGDPNLMPQLRMKSDEFYNALIGAIR